MIAFLCRHTLFWAWKEYQAVVFSPETFEINGDLFRSAAKSDGVRLCLVSLISLKNYSDLTLFVAKRISITAIFINNIKVATCIGFYKMKTCNKNNSNLFELSEMTFT